MPKAEDIVDVVIGQPGPTSDIKICGQTLSKFDSQQTFIGDKAYLEENQIRTSDKKPKNVELTENPQGVTKGFKGNQDKDSSQMNPKEIEWLRQPPKISICYHHSIRPVYKPA